MDRDPASIEDPPLVEWVLKNLVDNDLPGLWS